MEGCCSSESGVWKIDKPGAAWKMGKVIYFLTRNTDIYIYNSSSVHININVASMNYYNFL